MISLVLLSLGTKYMTREETRRCVSPEMEERPSPGVVSNVEIGPTWMSGEQKENHVQS